MIDIFGKYYIIIINFSDFPKVYTVILQVGLTVIWKFVVMIHTIDYVRYIQDFETQ